jgi:class 3 adenylate cyclase/tetratricopeptide (TPR) repeat protein
VAGGRFCAQCGTPVPLPADPVAPSAAAERSSPTEPAAPTSAAVPTEERAAPPGPERRLVTILFADLVGSTALGEETDPEDLTELINGAFEVMTRAVSNAGGHMARLMGDGLLAFFGAPVSHEDDPLRAVRAALGIRDGLRAYGERVAASGGPPVAVRVGLDSGLVLVGQVGSDVYSEYTTMGDAANTAARLQSAAPPGEILVSEETARLIHGAVELEPVAPLVLKGKSAPVAAFRVTGPPPELGVSVRGLPGVTTPLVGREAERARLQGLFEDAMASRLGAWVTLTGEAGVGKSRLLMTFLDDVAGLEQAVTILRARAVEQDSGAYGLIRSLLGSRYAGADEGGDERGQIEAGVAADLAGAPGVDAARAGRDLARLALSDPAAGSDPRGVAERGLAALETLTRRLASTPLILAVEDLHWADDASLDAMARLADALRDRPAMLLGNARPTLFVRRPLWGEGEGQHLRLDLAPLSSAATGRLVDALIEGDEPLPEEVLQFVAERSEGNPYYIEELVRMLLVREVLVRTGEGWQVDRERLDQGHVPTTLQGMLQARLDALDPAEKQALQRASVIGRVFWSGALVALGVTALDVLDRLRGRGMLFARERSSLPGEREFLFKHALLRDAAYATLLKKQRPALHGAAADWLVDRAGGRYGELAAQIAWHCEAAERLPEAATHFCAAGDRALATYANADAVDHYGRAIDLWPPEDAAGRFTCLKGRESALDMLGRREEQRADLEAMAALAEGMDGPAESYVHFRRSWLAHGLGDNAMAANEARRALRAAGRDPQARANALINLGNAQWALEQYADSGDSFREALRIRHELGDEHGSATALLGVARASESQGDMQAARDGYKRALEMYRRQDDIHGQAVSKMNMAITLAMEGDLVAAAPHFQAALDLYRSAGDRVGEGKALHNLGFLASEQGAPDLAEARLREALAIFRATSQKVDERRALKDLADVLQATGRQAEAADIAAGFETSLVDPVVG